ncbi:unnamed protein product [Enterobius vermicularis]|uniref:KATNIP domain-containing protein n=1 Tax=Enterobius vermicularis TaxID=51028 RepID=A0A3P6IXR2_ENTVE|nr:unnamed protein product [Enterobius vermicularis]
MLFSDEFEIPELPKGKELRFILLNSWDDPYNIGLNTIEIFTDNGKRPILKTVRFYQKRFTALTFSKLKNLQNYDESRVHALRGVHDLAITLEDTVIFQGEITCAFTADNDLRPMGDTILFTTDEAILERIAENDVCLVDDDVVASSMDLLTSDTLLNGRNLTRNREDMWLVPYRSNSSLKKYANLKNILGVCIWNYNASLEMSYAGVRRVQFYFDGKPLTQVTQLRKAPGFVFFDFVQDVIFHQSCLYRPPSRFDSTIISGFIYQVRLLSTWGDEFYIGLNGIELYDENDQLIKLGPNLAVYEGAFHIAAFPESVNILPGVHGDPRTSENLIDGINETTCASHMWLTPVLPNRCVRVFVIFDYSIKILKIILYNYTKTPERGARHVSVSVDDLIVFSGEVPPSTLSSTGKLVIILKE